MIYVEINDYKEVSVKIGMDNGRENTKIISYLPDFKSNQYSDLTLLDKILGTLYSKIKQIFYYLSKKQLIIKMKKKYL